MVWFKKTRCIHCTVNSTKREFEDQPTCAECKTKILIGRETSRKCPVDGSTLLKESSNEIIVDRCPTCKGIWLDAGELKAIKEASAAEGMAVGMVLF
ncbi:MAG: hypothetical protein ACI93R_001650 [Flavobacteriales bacterium]|jgi:hypothetical protein